MKNVENENKVLIRFFGIGERFRCIGEEGRGVVYIFGRVGWGVRPGRFGRAENKLSSRVQDRARKPTIPPSPSELYHHRPFRPFEMW